MKNNIKGTSSKSSASINFYQLLNKYFFLLFGVTCLSVVTITKISGNSFCPTNSYSWESTSSDSLKDTNLALENSNNFVTWFYTLTILGCSVTPWLFAYIFRHKALLIAQKNLRYYPSAAKTQTPKQQLIPTPVLTPVLSTPKVTNPRNSAPSYRITAFKSSSKKKTSFSNNTKNIKLPFERLK